MTRTEVPALPRRLWYRLGGKLPTRYAEWVFQDVTRPGWMLRFTLGSMLRVLPFTVLVTLLLTVLLDVPFGMALSAGSLGLIVGAYFSLSYAEESVENRITEYGYPHGLALQTRRDRNDAAAGERQARYNAAWRRD